MRLFFAWVSYMWNVVVDRGKTVVDSVAKITVLLKDVEPRTMILKGL